MFRRNQTTYLPLLLSGLPVLAVEWLRVAGIPAVGFQTTAALSRRGANAAGQVLLFDARSATGRLDSRTARECGAEIINVSDLLPRGRVFHPERERVLDAQAADRLQADRAAFFDELKLRVEAAGGIWLRLGDYPFPYQSAACRSFDPARDLQALARTFAFWQGDAASLGRPRRATREDVLLSMRRRYACGQPAFIGNAEPGRDRREVAATQDSGMDEFPLMWRTSGEELTRWCRVRSQLELSAWRTGSTYRIECTGELAGFRPTMELWLGSHVASLPLVGRTMTVREEGIVFMQEHRRHPAGMAAGWSADSGFFDVLECFAHQPA